MASTYSPSLRLELMATGDQSGTWGDTTNVNLGTLLEQSITGYLSKAMADANQTLTSLNGAFDEARNMVVEVTGALTAGRNVVVPTAEKIYLIKNSTTGGFAVTVKTSAGTGVAVQPGANRWVYCDGTNVVDGQSGPLTPTTSDSAALGSATLMWSDLFLASGGVINWNNGALTLTQATETLTQTFTDAGATVGPVYDLYRDSSTPAVNDVLGRVAFNGRDSAGNKQEYGSIEAIIADPTSTSEDGALDFYTTVAGTRTRTMSLGPGISGTVIATIPQQESGSALDVIVTPGRQQFHPSAVKAWGCVTVAAGVPTLVANYNIASIADSGVGRLTVTIGVDFSTANYVVVSNALTGNDYFISVLSTSVGSFDLACWNSAGVLTDPTGYFFICMGDQ